MEELSAVTGKMHPSTNYYGARVMILTSVDLIGTPRKEEIVDAEVDTDEPPF